MSARNLRTPPCFDLHGPNSLCTEGCPFHADAREGDAWTVGEDAAKPLARFGSASVRKVVAEARAKAEIGGLA